MKKNTVLFSDFTILFSMNVLNIQMTRQASITVIAASFNPFYMSCPFFFFLSLYVLAQIESPIFKYLI